MESTPRNDDNQPATKGDLRQLAARFDGRIGQLETHMGILHEDLRELRKLLFNAVMGGAGILGALLVAAVAALLM